MDSHQVLLCVETMHSTVWETMQTTLSGQPSRTPVCRDYAFYSVWETMQTTLSGHPSCTPVCRDYAFYSVWETMQSTLSGQPACTHVWETMQSTEWTAIMYSCVGDYAVYSGNTAHDKPISQHSTVYNSLRCSRILPRPIPISNSTNINMDICGTRQHGQRAD